MTRLARALNSDDLTHRETDCDADVLQATGAASIRRNLGVLIIEAREGCAGDGPHAVARIRDLQEAIQARVKAIARRWRVRVDILGVSAQVVRELVLDRCMQCQGRGFIPMKYDGSRLVVVNGDDEGSKDIDCSLCLGSGAARRDYHGRAKSAGWKEYDKHLSEWWEALLQSCADAEMSARSAIWRRLRSK